MTPFPSSRRSGNVELVEKVDECEVAYVAVEKCLLLCSRLLELRQRALSDAIRGAWRRVVGREDPEHGGFRWRETASGD
jgi:hypothetical protein